MPKPVQHDIGFMLTPRVACEPAHHESACLEAYLDSQRVWTWGIGVTDKSGHKVERYKDKPSDLATVISIYLWLLRTKYGPEVLEAFTNFSLTEHEFAAALSFHFNTGAIGHATWVETWKAVKLSAPGVLMADAREQFLDWKHPKEIIPRREAEAKLFFEDQWAGNGKLLVLPVRKPSYSPAWGKGKEVDVRDMIAATLKAQQ